MFIALFTIGVLCLGMMSEQLSYVKTALFNAINALLDATEQATELADLDSNVGTWRAVFIGTGVVSIFAGLSYLFLSINSFSISRRFEYYHMSN